MKTIVLSYTSENTKISEFQKNQNNVVKFIYNRLKENPKLSQKELTDLVNSMNNVYVDSWFKQSAIYEAKAMIQKEKEDDEKVIFGGKKLFIQRCQNKISKEEFQIRKLIPLYIIGEARQKGNRKIEFRIKEENKIIYKPKNGIRIELRLPNLRKNYKRDLLKLQELMEQKKIPVTVSLDSKKIYITYDETKLSDYAEIYEPVKNRILTDDQNPNTLGYSIVDWKDKDTKKILKTVEISIKKLNDAEFALKKDRVSSSDPRMKYIRNKRNHEIFEINKRLVQDVKRYKVEFVGIEQLVMPPKNNKKGKKFNRLVNGMWCRNKQVSNLKNRLKPLGVEVLELYPQYSSFIGNLLNRSYPDAVAASLEINRRAFCLTNKIRPVVFPDFQKSLNVTRQSLEELFGGPTKLLDDVSSWKELYQQFKKNPELRYRTSLEDCKRSFKVFSLFDKKSLIEETVFQ